MNSLEVDTIGVKSGLRSLRLPSLTKPITGCHLKNIARTSNHSFITGIEYDQSSS